MDIIDGWSNLYDLAMENNPSSANIPLINQIVLDMPELGVIPTEICNDGTGHKVEFVTGIPKAFWSRLGQPVPDSRSQTQLGRVTTGRAEAWSHVPKWKLDLCKDKMLARYKEDTLFRQSVREKIGRGFWDADEKITPESFTGMRAYYSSTKAKSGKNILPAWDYLDPAITPAAKALVDPKQSKAVINLDFKTDGTPEQRAAAQQNAQDFGEIFLMVFGDKRTIGLVPEKTVTGIDMWADLNPRVKDTDEGSMLVYSSQFTMDYGLVPQDWRYCVRGTNIRISALSFNAKFGVNLVNMCYDMDGKLPTEAGENYRAAWFMPKKLKTILNVQRNTLGFGAGNTSDWAGRRGENSFLNYPIFTSDAMGLKNTRLKFAA